MIIQNYKGIKVTVKEEDLSTGVIGLVTPVADNIVEGEYYTLQFKIINFNTNNALDYLVLTSTDKEQKIGHVECSGFQTVGILKEYLDDEFGYEEKLCFIRFKAEFSSDNARVGIARRMTTLDKPDDTAFLIRDVSLCRGMVLVPWQEMPNDIQMSIEKVQSEIKQTAKGLSFAVTSVEHGVAENKASIDIMDKEVKIAVESANTASNEASYAKGEVQVLAGQINNKVSANEVMSMIQQNPTDVKYYFNEISPSVTINSSGLIVHNGSIACDTLTTPSGHDPIVKLFPNNGSYCSIDATRQYESGGRGDWIRLKWDSSNYWYVGKNSAGVYLNNPTNETDGEYASQFWVSTTHSRLRTNKLMIGRDNCRIDTTNGYFRLYTSPDGSEDRGVMISPNSGRLSIRNDGVYFARLNSNGTVASEYSLGGSVSWSDVTNKPSSYPPSSHSHNYASSSHSHGNYYEWGDTATFKSCMPTSHNGNQQYCGTVAQAWSYVCCYSLRYNNYSTSVSGYSMKRSVFNPGNDVKNFFKNYTKLSQEIPEIPQTPKMLLNSRSLTDSITPKEYEYNDVFVMNENGESFVDGAKMSSYQSQCLELLVNENSILSDRVNNLESEVEQLKQMMKELLNK